jgi:hypothetical protein
MGRRLIRVMLAATLLAVLFPSTVLATGDCNQGYVVLWQHANLQGNWVKMCYGVNDPDTSSETDSIGPDYQGNYQPDFDVSNTGDGMSSFQLYINPSYSIRWCYYYGTNYVTQMFSETASRTNTLNILENDQGSSLRWLLASQSC